MAELEQAETLYCARCCAELAVLSASSFLCDACVLEVAGQAAISCPEPS